MIFFQLLGKLILLFMVLALLAVVFTGMMWFYFSAYIPWKNERNAVAAHAWNDDYWQSGHGLRVTVTMKFSGPSGTVEAHETLLCTAKYLVQVGGLKNGPNDFIRAYTTGPGYMSVPIVEGMVLRADIRNACNKALTEFDPKRFYHLGPLRLDLTIISSSKALACNVSNRTGSDSGNALRKAYISNVVAVPIQTLMQKSDFENINAYDPSNWATRWDTPYGYRNRVHWDRTRKCWVKLRSTVCNIPAEQICGTRYFD